MWQPRDVVAAILAGAILVAVGISGVAHIMGIASFDNTELIGAWRDVLLTLLGALAGYIGGSAGKGG